MKRSFIHDDFLLQTKEACELYHGYAADKPIIDYHCHLPPDQVAADHRFRNIADAWLGGDHYKWRVMRCNGVAERFCTGGAPDREKFDKWAETMPYLLRNPLYHWTHLELVRYFGVTDLLSPQTADAVWDACNARLAEPGFSCRGLMERSNVVLVCTTDDPVDSLEHHRAVAADPAFKVRVLPAWRPDKAMAVEDTVRFNEWTNKLVAAADMPIGDFDAFMAALHKRHAFFHENGCRLSDHGLDTAYAADCTVADIKSIFHKVRSGHNLAADDVEKFKSAMLVEFGIMDCERDWTQQFHFGAQRNNNTRMVEALGPDTGFDSIGDRPIAQPLSRFLDRLARIGKLTRTILYNLNPADNMVLATMLGNFQDGSEPGKMQFGSGWWFLDQKDGMEQQMAALSNLGLLSRFVGMLTDSRSFLSYTRHEYFRRILCSLLGREMADGSIPHDMALVGRMVEDISYGNAARYFKFDL